VEKENLLTGIRVVDNHAHQHRIRSLCAGLIEAPGHADQYGQGLATIKDVAG
jgi:hypothetical protein